MIHSKYFDYFGHIREELSDMETVPRNPSKKKKSSSKKNKHLSAGPKSKK